MSTVTQRLSIAYTGTVSLLKYYLTQLSSDIEHMEKADKPTLRIFKSVYLIIEPKMVIIEVSSLWNLYLTCIFPLKSYFKSFFMKE